MSLWNTSHTVKHYALSAAVCYSNVLPMTNLYYKNRQTTWLISPVLTKACKQRYAR